MPVDLSIENAPESLVARLQKRAARNHRSLRSEVLAILEEAAEQDRIYSPADIVAEVRRIGLSTPGDSVDIIRADRDGHHSR